MDCFSNIPVSLLLPIPAVLVTAVTLRELTFELINLKGIVENHELSIVPRDPVLAGPSSL